MSETPLFIQIDEEGYFLGDDGVRYLDEDFGQELLTNLRIEDRGKIITQDRGKDIFVEAFDEPIIIKQIEKSADPTKWKLLAPYGFQAEFSLHDLYLDEWDRFHGETKGKIPFVFSRAAQAAFFDLLDGFDDDSITHGGEQIALKPQFIRDVDITQEDFWTNIYQTETPGWELGGPARAFANVLPKLKLSKLRVLVLAGGTGEDAALFARAGHIVTSVDLSDEALKRAREKFPDLKVRWEKGDVFNLPKSWHGQFDLVVEHACYNALPPEKRNDLVRVWRQMLAPQGHLLGVFFTMYKRKGPPFGGSEWEMRERLKKNFRFLLWRRWRDSVPRREARELLVYAQLL